LAACVKSPNMTDCNEKWLTTTALFVANGIATFVAFAQKQGQFRESSRSARQLGVLERATATGCGRSAWDVSIVSDNASSSAHEQSGEH